MSFVVQGLLVYKEGQLAVLCQEVTIEAPCVVFCVVFLLSYVFIIFFFIFYTVCHCESVQMLGLDCSTLGTYFLVLTS